MSSTKFMSAAQAANLINDGDISFEHEAANLDAQSLALAARNSGGKVIVQVRERLPHGALKAREMRIPSAWVDAIVVDPDQQASPDIPFEPALSGELTGAYRYQIESADHAAERPPPAKPSANARPSPAALLSSCSTPECQKKTNKE